MNRDRTTMAEIADAAGVSLPTVSKVWNGRADVSERTRRRVEELMRKHGYRGRTPRQESGLIDVVFSEIDCSWEGEHIRGLEAAAFEADVRIVVSSLDHGEASRRRLLQRLRSGHTDGVILATETATAPLVAALSRLNVPLAALDPVARHADMPFVHSANFAGARAATAHLLALGHRRIGLITGLDQLVCSQARRDGFFAAHDEAGVSPDLDLVERGDYNTPSGITAGGRLLDRHHPPTAIFAMNDGMAIGVYEAARRRGVTVPDQLSVVGFDDLPGARWASPPLTTVRQPLREMGALAVRTVLGHADGGMLGTELVVRESTSPPL
ncbi:LacI family DNA-binding transcriptional regulator [Actinoplanes couchii]|uniref:LacI family transcriptional regulator n=1 Tax=Actinoplanes couchii TaxID=403638 RepID=A0ABQ3XMX9_9ACTN|nr:LacI family DNA-binding transcriptional regulator [Actinoplanes couchii]MDR6317870.1 LacI family transcriptional regulator [Actinoplanes couchii]GID59858.1 LacI family transcriptional regulator [Actinoplanes couchii]